jgi:hypothetical protein
MRNMDRRWKDAMVKGMIGGTHLFMGRPCMLLVAERLTYGEIIIIFAPCFDVSFNYTLHHLNIKDT